MADFIVQMRAVVIGFDGVAAGIMIVGMKGVEVGADTLHRFKVLCAISTIAKRLSSWEHT